MVVCTQNALLGDLLLLAMYIVDALLSQYGQIVVEHEDAHVS